MRRLSKQFIGIRRLHTFPEAPDLTSHNVIRATPVVDPRVRQVPDFRVMGQGAMLQVQLPASIELVAKYNALTGILGPGSSDTKLSARFQLARSLFTRLLTRQPILQQKIISTAPITCLFGAKNRHLSAIELNGSVDWVVRSQVLAYTGKHLTFTPRTGFKIGGAPIANTEVSGRGWICLSTPASPVQINVAEGERILVARRNLNAYSVDSNASSQPPVLKPMNFEISKIKEVEPELEHNWWGVAMGYWKQTLQVVRRLSRAGNNSSYLEIYGPATVLVSSSRSVKRVNE